MPEHILETTAGKVRGRERNGLVEYLGIRSQGRYASSEYRGGFRICGGRPCAQRLGKRNYSFLRYSLTLMPVQIANARKKELTS